MPYPVDLRSNSNIQIRRMASPFHMQCVAQDPADRILIAASHTSQETARKSFVCVGPCFFLLLGWTQHGSGYSLKTEGMLLYFASRRKCGTVRNKELANLKSEFEFGT